MKDPLGDRMKSYESATTSQVSLNLTPLIVRVDGKCFSNYTRGLPKPYCNNFIKCMYYTCKRLSKQFNSNFSYVQSDEITLCLMQKHYKEQLIFNGKLFKIISSAAAYATYFFNRAVKRYLPYNYSKKLAIFDARAFNVPNMSEVVNCFIWRQQDAIRNAILCLAQNEFGKKSIHGVNTKTLKEKLDEAENRYINAPSYYKYGIFLTKCPENNKYKKLVKDLKTLTFDEKLKLLTNSLEIEN